MLIIWAQRERAKNSKKSQHCHQMNTFNFNHFYGVITNKMDFLILFSPFSSYYSPSTQHLFSLKISVCVPGGGGGRKVEIEVRASIPLSHIIAYLSSAAHFHSTLFFILFFTISSVVIILVKWNKNGAVFVW